MKKIITIAFILIGFSMNDQTPFFSAYNKGKPQPKNVVFGEWKNYNGSETFLYELSPTGYNKTLSELKNVLDFYGLDIDAEDYDDSLFYENESIYDIQKIYTNCILKYSNIVKIYRAKYVNITFIVTDEFSNIQISKIKS
ncbi:hypothetical protein [Flavobacterium ammonificans]|jgi:hypothetical protein|uniref:hypothetical protein n=1 Tax=Flavobacterium ammonificans TaxID=1751056 RepID=UPI001E5C5791|nr:hypothetical protein [Flavobacterium ammonificans]BDB56149.1 hypothetical protein SHINM13_04450 [Flavobacterium ammonificans]